MRASRLRFIRQQGFTGDTFPGSLYTALMLQPRIVGVLVALGVLLQSAPLFIAVGLLLWWSALVPRRNPFDAVYNHVVAYPRGLPPLQAAPTPRRFAAGESGTVAIAAGVAMAAGHGSAWILQAVYVGGILSAVFADFCVPAYTYHALRRLLAPRTAAFSAAPQGDGHQLTGLPAGRR
jgi:hypothetical protein